MPAISIMIEGQMDVTWARWKRVAHEVEALGFAGLFRSDHFTNPAPPDLASLESVVSLAYLADRTERIHFGPLVSPVSFRDPVMLARQAAAIDDLSGGRMILGLGAGWQEREHDMFGYELGDLDTRFARLEEALDITVRLLRDDAPVNYAGTFYQLHEASLLPRPEHGGGPRILIGGNGPKRTLPLVARYADIWNAVGLDPGAFRERCVQLDQLLVAAGRQPADVRRTMMTGQMFALDQATFEQQLRGAVKPDQRELPFDELLAAYRSNGWSTLHGTPDMIAEQLQAYAAAGVEEFMLQWFELDDLSGLRAFAEHVLPLAVSV